MLRGPPNTREHEVCAFVGAVRGPGRCAGVVGVAGGGKADPGAGELVGQAPLRFARAVEAVADVVQAGADVYAVGRAVASAKSGAGGLPQIRPHGSTLPCRMLRRLALGLQLGGEAEGAVGVNAGLQHEGRGLGVFSAVQGHELGGVGPFAPL
jgi:hypothetical protein